MPLTVNIQVSLEEANALYQTVRSGRRYFQDHPIEKRPDLNLSLQAQGLAADRFVSYVLTQLAEAARNLPEGDPLRSHPDIMGPDLDDAEVPDATDMIELLQQQEKRNG